MTQKKTKDSVSYEAAQTEWDQRIGSARAQVRNWRLACLGSLIILILLLICLVNIINKHKTMVYIAQVKPGQNIAQLHQVSESISATQTQKLYFLNQFISNTMSIPLDPVLMKKNWLNAYQWVSGAAVNQLTHMVRTQKPFSKVGNITQTVQLIHFHPVSPNTYELTWSVKSYTLQGKQSGINIYNGSFTLKSIQSGANLQQMLNNPYGLQIVYFNISKEG